MVKKLERFSGNFRSQSLKLLCAGTNNQYQKEVIIMPQTVEEPLTPEATFDNAALPGASNGATPSKDANTDSLSNIDNIISI
jgi:hypothetical protein